MKYITNIDTLSALLDRLISENIKLYFFKKEKLNKNITHQEEVIKEIKIRIKNLLLDVYKNKEYNYISEKRTYKADMTLDSLEQLTALNSLADLKTLWFFFIKLILGLSFFNSAKLSLSPSPVYISLLINCSNEFRVISALYVLFSEI